MVEQAQGEVGGASVDAAMRALESQEYEQIQIRDVAQMAAVALGTLYRYFSSKEHLYAAVLQEWAAFGRARRGRVATTPEERVRQRIHAIIRAFERQPQFFKVYLLLQSSVDPNAKALFAEFATSAHASLVGELESLGPDQAQDVAIMLWSIINTMVTHAIYHGGTMQESRRVADRFIDLLSPRLGSPD